MTEQPRNEAQILKDRADIAKYLLQGRRQNWIADKLNMTEAMVSRDAKAIKTEWKRSAAGSIEAAKEQALAEIDLIKQEAWDAWEASKRDAEVVMKYGGEGRPAGAQKIVSTRNAHKAYLDTLAWCNEQRCKILGLYATPGESADHPLHVRQMIVEVMLPSDEESS